MYVFLIPLLLGFALVGASAFTAAYSHRWGERAGEMATSILRNFLGIPLGFAGFTLAWLEPAPRLFGTDWATKALGWFLVLAGSVPFIWGHVLLVGERAGPPHGIRSSVAACTLGRATPSTLAAYSSSWV